MSNDDVYAIDFEKEPAIDLVEYHTYFRYIIFSSQEDRYKYLADPGSIYGALCPPCHPCFHVTTPNYDDIPERFIRTLGTYKRRPIWKLGKDAVIRHYKWRKMWERIVKESTEDGEYDHEIVIINELPHPGDKRVLVPVIYFNYH
ncbi:hypothetical protein GS501_04640 [Saccharibacter sp. 17.LH.SD]|uniref:hypothetical protein n=1 Tax=Saccharibacter sp. 17.LH.SD TaxID=2689393 RepID=UPI0013713BAF|nr:hypothetical protein [Saccharibacter sp. 17.LH.SD]MXV44333.1 hypothetical protein [Saccharibacter sp. 17.LH.SD]